jgi:NADP-dependent 3-hydroxy acid dehydrogenase YdfG
MDINDKVILITGASSGIGRVTARHLAGLGAKVVLAARHADALRDLERELPGSVAIPTDITKPDEAAQLVKKTIAHFGRVDVLVNSAGRAMAKPVEHIDLGEYGALLDLNVIAPLRLMQLVIPHLRSQGGGQVVNLSSQASTKYIPYIAGYASTKFALNNLSLTAREELARDGIVVSIVKPGIVDTDFGQNSPSPEPGHLRRADDGSLLSHVIAPEAVASAVAAIIVSGDAEIDILER